MKEVRAGTHKQHWNPERGADAEAVGRVLFTGLLTIDCSACFLISILQSDLMEKFSQLRFSPLGLF